MKAIWSLFGFAVLVVACVFGVNTVIALGFGEVAWTVILGACTAALTVFAHRLRAHGRAPQPSAH